MVSGRIEQALPTQRLAWSLAEVAALLGVSLPTVKRKAKNGDVRTMKFGRRRLVPDEELQRLLKGEGQKAA